MDISPKNRNFVIQETTKLYYNEKTFITYVTFPIFLLNR